MSHTIKKFIISILAVLTIAFVMAPFSISARASLFPTSDTNTTTSTKASIWGEIVNFFDSIASFLGLNKKATIPLPTKTPTPAISPNSMPTINSHVSNFVVLNVGDKGVAVSVLQKLLVKDKFLASSGVTGNYDSATETAVKAFQKAKGLPQTGVFTIAKSSLPAFYASASSTFVKLKLGSSGAQVTAIQSFLIKKGYLKLSKPTGTYGSSTQTAVKAFQKAKGLSQTGIIDQATFNAMNGK